MPAGPDQIALGAARAADERRRRVGTPLMTGPADPDSPKDAAPVDAAVDAPAATVPAPARPRGTRHPAGTPVAALTAGADATDPQLPARSRPHRPVPRVIPTAAPRAVTVDGSNRVRAAERRARRAAATTTAPTATAAPPTAATTSAATTSAATTPAATTTIGTAATTAAARVTSAGAATAASARPAVPAGASRSAPPETTAATGASSNPPGRPASAGPVGAAAAASAPQPRPNRPPRSAFRRPRPDRPAATETASAGAGAGAGRPGRTGDGQPSAFRPRIVRPDDLLDDHLLTQALDQKELTPGIEDVLTAGIGVLRTVAAASGLGGDEVEAFVAGALAFLRRRLTGDYVIDEYGFDSDYTENLFLPVMRFFYKQWFRVEVRGIENIPTEGGALVVANHSGTIALDAQMVQVAIHDEHPAARHLRLLGADLVFRTPLMGALARKQGATLAANTDAERLLTSGEVVGVFPEGFKGVGKPFSERYKLQRFGRGGFVSAALRTGTPIIPCSIVGAEETYPLVGDIKLLARLLGAPYFPITPTWPLLGPLGLLPLPSKWIIEFGEPVPTEQYGSAAADDPMLVFDLTDQVRETIQQTLYSLLMLRRSVFS